MGQASIEQVIAQQARKKRRLLKQHNNCTTTRSCSYLVQKNHGSLLKTAGKMDQATMSCQRWLIGHEAVRA
jgi:hypothetical protein